ncbi:MAG: L-threonylcarbamoyladenylate synthase [Opitutaceae bacterium]|nr:L-threonylcarbamoyladenylate synthase [Opitutaceae bacterium]
MTAQIYAPTQANLHRLVAALHEGDLVALPTETVYGLAANAFDARACQKIFRAKGRPKADPLIVHVLGLQQAALVAELNPAARQLARAFWPGPLTMVLPKKSVVPDAVTSGLSSVAVRAPAHSLFQKILRMAGRPLAAPSANRFGCVSPTTAEHVQEGLGRQIPHILDGGSCQMGVESTIVDLRDPDRPRLLRPGVISAAQLETVLGKPLVDIARASQPASDSPIAPGMMKRHYSPKTELHLVRRITARLAREADRGVALLYYRKPANPSSTKGRIFWMSSDGSSRTAARRLYAALHAIDRLSLRCLYVEAAPAGAGPEAAAINDRLRRAAARR